MDIGEALAAVPPAPATPARRPEHPTGREYEWNGSTGWLRTEPLTDRPTTWDEFICDAGLNPDEVEVIEPVQVRGWDMPKREDDGTTSLVRAHYYRLNLQRRGLRVDLEDLVKAAKRSARKPVQGNRTAEQAEQAFVVALGDLQLGKMDGDGVEGTVGRFLAATTEAVKRYRRIAKGASVYLIHLGDCIEGFMSQGGANAWRTTLTTTEQVRLYRRLLVEQIKAFAAVTPQLVVCAIPGNHDEAHRPLHTYGDSWAIDAASAVRDALELAGNYEHVTIHAPERDELTLTLDVAGTVIGMAHGHQWRPGQAVNWWAKQSHGRQAIGDADLLLSAHLHHLRVEATGSDKTWMQVPALESGSQWWKHRTGEWGQPGVLTLLAGGGSWSALEVL
jgi:predicted phosphodiesterase